MSIATEIDPMRFLFIMLLIANIAGEAAAAKDGDKCFASWSEASVVVRKEALVAVEEVSTRARQALPGTDVVKSTLCRQDGRYIYRLVVREATGQVRTVNVDARKPFQH